MGKTWRHLSSPCTCNILIMAGLFDGDPINQLEMSSADFHVSVASSSVSKITATINGLIGLSRYV